MTYPNLLHFSLWIFGFCRREQWFLLTIFPSKLSQHAVVFCRRPPPQLTLHGPQPPGIQTNLFEGFRKFLWMEYVVFDFSVTSFLRSFLETTTCKVYEKFETIWLLELNNKKYCYSYYVIGFRLLIKNTILFSDVTVLEAQYKSKRERTACFISSSRLV